MKRLSAKDLKALKSLINKANNIVITTHWSPDGDAIGSSLGLMQILKNAGKKVNVVVPNAYPNFLNWLPNNHSVVVHQNNEKKAEKLIQQSDLVFTLDFNALKRIADLGVAIEKAKKPIVMVDHHRMPDAYAVLKYHDINACSTCELIYDMAIELGYKKHIDEQAAECLYTGILTDSGSFKFESVTAHTHEIAAELIKLGVKQHLIQSKIYDTNSFERLQLIGFALSKKLVYLEKLNTAYITLSEKELKQFKFKKGDTEGLVNYALSVAAIEFSAIMMERDGEIKCSFRSKGDFDVNVFSRTYFDGGGHKNAAGGVSRLGLRATEQLFLKVIKKNYPKK
jgi:bifunctional oligoribonuclease and PAP phosphatase NrnA